MRGYPPYFQGFGDDMGQGTAFHVVLRGHLWVEAELLRTLTALLPHPERSDLDDLSLRNMAALVAGHGLMQEDELGAFKRLNKLRNNLAHQLDAKVTEQDELSLVNALGARQLEALRDIRSHNPRQFPNDLRNAITVMCVLLQDDRAHHESQSNRLPDPSPPTIYRGL